MLQVNRSFWNSYFKERKMLFHVKEGYKNGCVINVCDWMCDVAQLCDKLMIDFYDSSGIFHNGVFVSMAQKEEWITINT